MKIIYTLLSFCVLCTLFAFLPPEAPDKTIRNSFHDFASPEMTDSIVDTAGQKLSYSHFTAQNYAQNYNPWLSNSLDSLVKSSWSAQNMQYIDVTLHLATRSKVGSVVLYDHQGVFTTNPARIFVKKDTTLTQIGIFEGRRYLVFDTLRLNDSLEADAIVIRKYGNNIPQKIWAYGRALGEVSSTLPTINPPVSFQKMPVDTNRLIILNYAPQGLNALFDGTLTINPVTGYGNFMEDYEAWYPLDPGETMDLRQIKMYDYSGAFPDKPMEIWLADSFGTKKKVATFTGSRFQEWVGPDPIKDPHAPGVFNLDTACINFRYIVFKIHKNNLPAEIEFLGNYTAPTSSPLPAPRPMPAFANGAGVNGFEWDFVVPSSTTSRILNPTKYAAIKPFTGFRHYLDWQRIENTEGSYSFNPANWGGWSYDLTYEQLFKDSIEALVCLQNVPPWMRNTYPAGEQSTDNSPLKFGLDRMQPSSYIEKARAGFQIAARYGRNTNIEPSLIKVNTQPRWPNDPPNEVKTGLGWVKYIECDNEANKWWRGRKGYLGAFEYAAHLSAFYDGHKGTLGAGVGVKNADPTMQVVMMGMAAAEVGYVRGMVEWCRMNRGYRPDGSVDLCWDVINYHHYTNDKNSNQTGEATRGLAPELSKAAQLAKEFVDFSRKYSDNMPVWITELGYDLHQESPMKAIPVGNRTPLQTQADWVLRSALVYMRTGMDRMFFYEINDNSAFSATKYNTMGLSDSLFQLRPSGRFLTQAAALLKNYHYKQSLSADPMVDEYTSAEGKAYALWIPDETGRTGSYQLSVPGFAGVMVYKPTEGSAQMESYWITAQNGIVTLPLTETPVFAIPQTQMPDFLGWQRFSPSQDKRDWMKP